MQTVIIGKNSGFCFGVKRAVNTAIEMADKNVCVLGKLIHNDNVINELEKKGVFTISNIEDANNRTVIIRTHGEAKAVFQKAEELGIKIIDCTCPFVKDIQNKVVEFYNKGYKIVIVGKADHPEIIGINGWINNSALITENPDDVINLSEKKICVVVQTTYSNEKFDNFVKKIESLSNKKLEIFKTICYTTIRRQAETEDLSKNCDAVVVIGGKESSNTDKLFELAKKHQQNVFRIYDPQVFDTNKLKKYRKVGIVCGASTPIEQAQRLSKQCQLQK
jgi:4-hydroxy-3-methylbut-2-enyl diphosphate reductase